MGEILKAALDDIDLDDVGRPWETQVIGLATAVFEHMPPVAAAAGALGAGPMLSWPGVGRVSGLLTAVLEHSDLDEIVQVDTHDAVLAIVVGFGLGAVGQIRPSDRAIIGAQVATSVAMVLAGAKGRLPAAA